MVTVEQLTTDPHPHLARLRVTSPVAWVCDLDSWVVTGRDAAVAVMRDSGRFTVDDSRFTTGRVVGPSMLSTDGADHARHRAAFAEAFRPAATRERLEDVVINIARRRVADAASQKTVDLRTAIAGPVAAEVAIEALGLVETSPAEVLEWYIDIVEAVSAMSVDLRAVADSSLMRGVRTAVARTVATPNTALAATRESAAKLTDAEFASNVAIVMFGALETSESMITNLLRFVIADPRLQARLRADPAMRDRAIEESLRLEPGASIVDRYAVGDCELAGQALGDGDHVTVSLSGANRDPAFYAAPDSFSLDRTGEPAQLAFATGPHVCLGAHLARMETRAVLDAWFSSGIEATPALVGFDAPAGLVFRKPERLVVENRPISSE
jgi:cytochrome P450